MGIFKSHREKDSFRSSDHPPHEHGHQPRTVVPWIESPLMGTSGDEHNLMFSQRHEADPLELFFDLVFVANLATFTSYHSISDSKALYAYVGFFAVIWTSWFQITLHDVRFARDSVYERACKMVQFVVFVGFALVGNNFSTAQDKPSEMEAAQNEMFQMLSATLLISRFLFVVQYTIVLAWMVKAGYQRLYLPLCLNILAYGFSCAVFAVTTTAFASSPGPIMYSLGYFVLFSEAAATIAISCKFKMLSFEKTHLIERMGLLTLIVIGEGAIGVTKTISKLLGKGHDLPLSGLIFCIILVLFLVFMLYFDNRPHGPFGIIREQIWSLLHFPLHLSIVGVVEGSQQMALARYVLMQSARVDQDIFTYCMDIHADGTTIVDVLSKTIKTFKLDKYTDSAIFIPAIDAGLELIRNDTTICNNQFNASFQSDYKARVYPEALRTVYNAIVTALYASVSISPPKNANDVEVAYMAWEVVYNYYWSAMAITFVILAAFNILVRHHGYTHSARLVSIGVRILITILPLGFIVGALTNHEWMYSFIGSTLVVPSVVLIHLAVVLSDGICGIWTEKSKEINKERRPMPIIVYQGDWNDGTRDVRASDRDAEWMDDVKDNSFVDDKNIMGDQESGVVPNMF